MEYLKLTNCDLVVSRIGIGCEVLGGTDWGKVDLREAARAVAVAWELGITLFDTADVYGLGRSEEALASALGKRRHEVVICTKVGVRWAAPEPGKRARTFIDSRPQYVIGAVEASLRRLRLDCLPLCLIHWPDPNTPIEDTMEALRTCQQAGKIRSVGVSNFSASQISLANAIVPLAAAEVSLSLINREAAQAIVPTCQELGVGVFAYGSLGQGFLTGKYGENSVFDGSDRRHRLKHFQPDQRPKFMTILERLCKIACQAGRTPTQVALRWALDVPGVTSIVVGGRTSAQVEENAAVADWHPKAFQLACLQTNSVTAAFSSTWAE